MNDLARNLPAVGARRAHIQNIDAEVVLTIKELIALGARTKIIFSLCGVSKYIIRRLRYNCTSKSGMNPDGVTWFLVSAERMAQAYMLIDIYHDMQTERGGKLIDVRTFIKAYRDYTTYMASIYLDKKEIININRFHSLIGHLRKGIFIYRSCGHCKHPYLDLKDSIEVVCHSCRSLKKYLCVDCDATLKHRGNGRSRCSSCKKKRAHLLTPCT